MLDVLCCLVFAPTGRRNSRLLHSPERRSRRNDDSAYGDCRFECLVFRVLVGESFLLIFMIVGGDSRCICLPYFDATGLSRRRDRGRYR